MAKDFIKQLEALTTVMGVSFSLHNNSISSAEVFSNLGLLPAIARRADQLCSLCLGYGIGVTFEDAEGSLLGIKVIFDDVTPSVLRYLCIADVLSELVKTAVSKDNVALDEFAEYSFGSLGFRRVKVLDSPTCWGCGAKNPNKSHPKWGKFGNPIRHPCKLPKTRVFEVGVEPSGGFLGQRTG